MPNRPTLNDLLTRLNRTSTDRHKDSKKYTKLTEALSAVTRLYTEFENKEIEKDYTRIIKTYRALDKACQEYLEGKGDHRVSDIGNARLLLVSNIKSLVSMDMEAITNVKSMEYKSLSTLVDAGRRMTVDVSGEKLEKFGGALSSRIRIQDEEKKLDGYFTPTTSVKSFEDEFTGVVDRFCKNLENRGQKDYSEAIRYLSMQKGYDGESLLAKKTLLEPMLLRPKETLDCFMKQKNIPDTKDMPGINYRDFYNRVIDAFNKSNNKNMKDLMEQDKFRETLFSVVYETSLEKNKNLIYTKDAKIMVGQNIDRRNVAMSEVAKLLGCPDVIAHSKTMTLQNGKDQIQGVFMENASGVNLGSYGWVSLHAQDLPIEISIESSEVSRQLADMQVLDYICGNIDRHSGNMIYEFEIADGKYKALKRVTGIDNDCSFGLLGEKQDTKDMVNPMDFIFMSKETAEIIGNMTKEMLQYSLSNLISEKEIDKAWERTNYLKQVLLNEQYTEDYTNEAELSKSSRWITLLNKEDWGKVTLDKLAQSCKERQENRYEGDEEAALTMVEHNLFYKLSNTKSWVEDIIKESLDKAKTNQTNEKIGKADETKEKRQQGIHFNTFTNNNRYEMVYDAKGQPHGINYLKSLKDNEAFWRLSFDGESLEKFSVKRNGNDCRIERIKDETKSPKVKSDNDLCAASLIVNKMLKELMDVDPALMRSSQEFRALKRSMYDLSCDMEKFGKDPTEKDPELLKLRLQDVGKKAEDYLKFKESQTKSGEPIKESTQKRIDAAKAIQIGINKLANARLGEGNNLVNSREVAQAEDYLFSLGINTKQSESLCDTMREIYQSNPDNQSKTSYDNIAKVILISRQSFVKQDEKAGNPKEIVEKILNSESKYGELQKKLANKLKLEEEKIVNNQQKQSKSDNRNSIVDVRKMLLDPKLGDRICNEVLKESFLSKKEKSPVVNSARNEEQSRAFS